MTGADGTAVMPGSRAPDTLRCLAVRCGRRCPGTPVTALAVLPPLLAAALLSASLLLPVPAAAQAAAPAPAAEVLDLSFDSFFRRPVGPRGLELSDALRAAQGRQVRLAGYMVAQEQPVPGRFLFTPLPLRMSEHADGEADDLPPSAVTVLLDPAHQSRLVPHQPGRLTLAGRLELGRDEEAGGRVSWIRLVLAPEALASERSSTASTAAPPHSH